MTRTRFVLLSHVVRSLLTYSLQVITLDPSSPWGYERKHAALHRAGRYDDAISMFETMFLKCCSRRIQRFVVGATTSCKGFSVDLTSQSVITYM